MLPGSYPLITVLRMWVKVNCDDVMPDTLHGVYPLFAGLYNVKVESEFIV